MPVKTAGVLFSHLCGSRMTSSNLTRRRSLKQELRGDRAAAAQKQNETLASSGKRRAKKKP